MFYSVWSYKLQSFDIDNVSMAPRMAQVSVKLGDIGAGARITLWAS